MWFLRKPHTCRNAAARNEVDAEIHFNLTSLLRSRNDRPRKLTIRCSGWYSQLANTKQERIPSIQRPVQVALDVRLVAGVVKIKRPIRHFTAQTLLHWFSRPTQLIVCCRSTRRSVSFFWERFIKHSWAILRCRRRIPPQGVSSQGWGTIKVNQTRVGLRSIRFFLFILRWL